MNMTERNIFYIKKFNHTQDKNLDISFVPPILRRRLSKTDRAAIFTLKDFFNVKFDEFIFTSEYGEFDRLEKIISQYTFENEVSPNQFSASVHNYFAGVFLGLINSTVPYSAVSAVDNSLSAGFLQAILSNYDTTLFCYSEIDEKSVSCLISKTDGDIKCKFYRNQTHTYQPEFQTFTDFLEHKRNRIDFDGFSVERLEKCSV